MSVRFGLELLDVEAVGLPPSLSVEMVEDIAPPEFAVLYDRIRLANDCVHLPGRRKERGVSKNRHAGPVKCDVLVRRGQSSVNRLLLLRPLPHDHLSVTSAHGERFLRR